MAQPDVLRLPYTRRREAIERWHASPWLPPEPEYRWLTLASGREHFLQKLFDAFGFKTLQVWVDAPVTDAGFDRLCCEGLVTALGECDGRPVAIAWSDFRVKGSSFGRANSRRFAAFLRHLRLAPEPVPLVYLVNSAGLSLMEGRTAFSDAFALWPELLRYAEERLVLTCASGKCLGLAPVLYGLGHYRVAVAHGTQVNLTGPEVIKLFFGEGFDFAARAAAERCLEHHELVHELVPSVEAALQLFRGLIEGRPAAAGTPAPLGANTAALLATFLDAAPLELVPGWCPRVRVLMGTRRGRPLGVFVNPLERSNNMITVRTLEKYAAGLDLFRALGLPVVSVLDSPGIDPRFEQSDANLIRTMLRVGERIIRYPHGAMSVVAGRCFGGASTLAFPKVFGGWRAVALRGAQFGVMHERIVDQVLRGSPRLLAEWRRVADAQGADYADLLAEGSLDALVDRAELPEELDRFLAGAVPLPPDTPAARVADRGRGRARQPLRLAGREGRGR
jgi:acetyl-CoA carboxylase carboxyltransferase component